MTADSPLIEARNVTRRHADGRRPLLDGISLPVAAEECLAVVGGSGSGKTLLLRALALLDPVDEGCIHWRGRPVRHDEVPRFRSAAIYMHQRPAVWGGDVAAALQVPFSLGVHRRRKFDPEWIVRRLDGLGRDASFLDKSTGELSGGEMQIVALLRAMQLEPDLLLLDEPTAALDARATLAVESLLAGWAADSDANRALVWVTHDAEQAARVGDRIVQMKDGRLSGKDSSRK